MVKSAFSVMSRIGKLFNHSRTRMLTEAGKAAWRRGNSEKDNPGFFAQGGWNAPESAGLWERSMVNPATGKAGPVIVNITNSTDLLNSVKTVAETEAINAKIGNSPDYHLEQRA
jgi:hypothetical protein